MAVTLKPELERRLYRFDVSTRAKGSERWLEGRIPYDSDSQDMGFVEKIARGAFGRALRQVEPCGLIWAHDQTRILASTTGKSLSLMDAVDGLHWKAKLRDSEAMREVFETVERDAPDASFGFFVIKDSWGKTAAGRDYRTLLDVQLVEITVGLLRGQGAYGEASASAALRALERMRLSPDALRAHQLEELHELEMRFGLTGASREELRRRQELELLAAPNSCLARSETEQAGAPRGSSSIA